MNSNVHCYHHHHHHHHHQHHYQTHYRRRRNQFLLIKHTLSQNDVQDRSPHVDRATEHLCPPNEAEMAVNFFQREAASIARVALG